MAEASCAALIIGSTSQELITTADAVLLPLMITAVGIIMSFVTSLIGTNFGQVTKKNVESKVKYQLVISSALMCFSIVPLYLILPEEFIITDTLSVKSAYTIFCTLSGLIAGLIIGIVTEYFTSNEYSPV